MAWRLIYATLVLAVGALTQRANALQFLTIRRYLSLVFASLILLLVGLALWNRSPASHCRVCRWSWSSRSRRA